jgi:hypothetical protein
MELQHLNSVLGISIAIHFAYSLISDFHWYFFKNIERQYDHMRKYCDESPSATDLQGLPSILWVLETKIMKRRFDLESSVFRLTVFTTATAVAETILLIVIAFYPTVSIANKWALISIIFMFSPITVVLVYSKVTHDFWIQTIQKSLDLCWAKYQDALEKDWENYS